MLLKRHLSLLLVFALSRTAFCETAAVPLTVPVAQVTLRQCYAWTLERSESLKIRQEDIQQSNARSRLALSTALPYLDWQFTDTWQDPKGVDELERRGFAGFVQKDQVESKFSLTQPLFSGLREFAAWSGSKHETQRNTLLLKRAALELFEKTANVFYAVIDHETNKANTLASLRLAEDQVKELQGFTKLGKSRSSEVYTAQAHAAALKAQVDRIDADINSAREELSFLTGKDLLAAPLQDEIPASPTVGPLNDVLTRAQDRTDLQAQRENAAAQKLRIRYEKGFYWPKADITGNYYTRRPTYLDAIDWDVVLSLKVPFFQGGAVTANVRAATSAYQQAQLRLEEMERSIVYSVRKTYGELAAAVREVQSLEDASQAAQKSYDALRKEYRNGLVTNLDVLQAVDFLQTQNSARDTARLKVKQRYIELNVALEQMP